MKRMKRILSILLVLFLMLEMVPESTLATASNEGTMATSSGAVISYYYNSSDILPYMGINGCNDYVDGNCITSVEIPEIINGHSVTWIMEYAFRDSENKRFCTNLASITLPATIELIYEGSLDVGPGSLGACKSLENIIVKPGGSYFSNNGVLYQTEYTDYYDESKVHKGTRLTCYPAGRTDSAFSVPDGVEVIGNAFVNCINLSSVSLPDSLINIEKGAFYNCSGLKNINIPNGVATIGVSAFCNCNSLSSITIPQSVTDIDMYAFSGCDSLTDVYYLGTEESWRKISIDSGNECLTSATIHYIDSQVNFNGHTYQIFDQPATWENARQICEQKGGHLATITSEAEQNFLSEQLQSHTQYCYWIGGTDAEQEGVWKWITGEPWDYENWMAGQPSNHSDIDGTVENYLVTERVKKQWNDLQNTGDSRGYSQLKNIGFICEWDNTPNPGEITFRTGPSATVSVGEELILIPDIPTNTPIGTPPTYKTTWTSSNESVATVEESNGGGFLLAKVFGKSAGTATITLALDDGRSASCEVQVTGISGICGESLTWKIKDGTLTISGTGEMDDYGFENEGSAPPPWNIYQKDITDVIVEEGAMSIGKCAFLGLTKAEEISIGSTVQSVNSFAFPESEVSLKIKFRGAAPSIDDAAFPSRGTNIYYDATTSRWNEAIMHKYEGSNRLAWIYTEDASEKLSVKDMWSFPNDAEFFGGSDNGYWISQADYKKLTSDLSNTEKAYLRNCYNTDGKEKKHQDWEGSCDGMSRVIALIKNKLLSPNDFSEQRSLFLVDYGMRPVSERTQSVINFYQWQQNIPSVTDIMTEFMRQSQEQQITKMEEAVNLAESTGTVAYIGLGYKKSDKAAGYHTVLGYGIEKGTFLLDINGTHYRFDRRILTYDPAYSGNRQPLYENAIYYNDTHWAWLHYAQPVVSSSNDLNVSSQDDTAQLRLVIQNANFLNSIDYKTGHIQFNHVPQNAYLYGSSRKSTVVTTEEMRYLVENGLFDGQHNSSDDGSIIFSDAMDLVNSADIPFTIAFPGLKRTYTVTAEDGPVNSSLAIDNYFFGAKSTQSGTVIFDAEGKTTLTTDEVGDAQLSLTTNQTNCILPWYTIVFEKLGAQNLSIQQMDDGVLIAGDNLTDVKIRGINDIETIELDFSTQKNSALLIERSKELLVLIDSDNDGKYDSPVNTITNKDAYKIVLDSAGGIVVPTLLSTSAGGRLIRLPSPIRPGYTFTGWYTAPDGGEQVTTDTVFTADTTIYAHWVQNDVPPEPVPEPAVTHYIHTSATQGGTITVTKHTAAPGDWVNVYVVPEKGYQLEALTATDHRGWPVTVREMGENAFSFTMPPARVTVNAVFSKLPEETENYQYSPTIPDKLPGTSPSASDVILNPSPMNFTDVCAADWFYNDVRYCWQRYLMTGISDTQFDPQGTTNRAMIWTVIARLAGRDTSGGSIWYERGQIWAKNKGITDGTDPLADVTREQLVTMLWRFKGNPYINTDNLGQFKDAAEVSEWAVQPDRWAVANGLLNGTYGNLNPQGKATRAEVAAILTRFCQNVG